MTNSGTPSFLVGTQDVGYHNVSFMSQSCLYFLFIQSPYSFSNLLIFFYYHNYIQWCAVMGCWVAERGDEGTNEITIYYIVASCIIIYSVQERVGGEGKREINYSVYVYIYSCGGSE